MSTVFKYWGTEVTVMLPCQQIALDGTVAPLATAWKVWPRLVESALGPLSEIVGATCVPATAPEIAALKYSGDKTLATWWKLTLPGGEATTDFAMRPEAVVMAYTGTAIGSKDMRAASAPISIVRIATGSERVE